ncbi:MAG: hypothetical protein ABIT34_00080 [Gammaproteobacteria bacterium]
MKMATLPCAAGALGHISGSDIQFAAPVKTPLIGMGWSCNSKEMYFNILALQTEQAVRRELRSLQAPWAWDGE